MSESIDLDGRTVVGVANDCGEVSTETTFEFEQDGDRLYGSYAGGSIVDGHLVGTLDDDRWNVRYVQLHADGSTATGHSVGELEILDDGRVRVEDEWEWESKSGSGRTVLEEVS